MTFLNRELQRDLLTRLAQRYPEPASPDELGTNRDDQAWNVNVMYLHEHGLVAASWSDLMGAGRRVHMAKITARGLDFMDADGGLSAILNTVTVRLEAETLKALLGSKVDQMALPAPEKSRLKQRLQEMGEDALKDIAKRLLDAALDQAPAALQLLQSMLG